MHGCGANNTKIFKVIDRFEYCSFKIRFVDDKCVIANTEKGLLRLTSSLDKVTDSYGSEISTKKTIVKQRD